APVDPCPRGVSGARGDRRVSVLLVAHVLLGTTPWWSSRHVPAGTRSRLTRWLSRRRRRQADRARVDVAVLLDLGGAALSAGASVPAMLQALGRAVGEDEAGPALRRAGVALVLGAPWVEAWSAAPRSVREL